MHALLVGMNDPLMWKDVASWLWVALGALAWIVWHRQDKDIKDKASAKEFEELKQALHGLRNRAVSRDELKAHEERNAQDRDERREAETLLFSKIDELKNTIDSKIDGITSLLLQMAQKK